MTRIPLFAVLLAIAAAVVLRCGSAPEQAQVSIPLPEHPRPDFMRSEWLNLNGPWSFALDSLEVGMNENWQSGETPFPLTITVPFSWAAPLSGIGRKDVHNAWYARDISVPSAWKDKRVYLVIGASDCVTTVWLNGVRVGEHEGGYTPFEFDLTAHLAKRGPDKLVIAVEDKPVKGRLVGKQVYGEAKGIWQTVYLEARPELHITRAHFTPDPDNGQVRVDIGISRPAGEAIRVKIAFDDHEAGTAMLSIPSGGEGLTMNVPIDNPHLWSLDDPYLYDLDVVLLKDGVETDRVRSYFGMRTIGVAKLPGSGHTYVTLNGEPVYLFLALDQAYHEEGFYTFPSDDFMRGEIERAKEIGLNGLRIHIKTEMPRKLYWADRLGLLLQCDVPNIGGEPDGYGRANWEHTAHNQFERDYNHPSIFSWVLFNETWGLFTRVEKSPGEFGNVYLPETQEWVRRSYEEAKKTDPSRLVEDNSPCNYDHVVTDINSWHVYTPGYNWKRHLDDVVNNTYPGSPWNYIGGNVQGDEPLMNSECGNVWGYRGGTGDVDIAYEYHIMVNEYRRRPKICGFLFTEFHDVINEWNGYYRFDRSLKEFGLHELCPGMSVADFHRACYLIPGDDFKMTVRPGATFRVPVTASMAGSALPDSMTVRCVLHGWNRLGEHREYGETSFGFAPKAWSLTELPPVAMKAPAEECLAMFCTYLVDDMGTVVHRNFMPVRVTKGASPRRETIGGGTVALRKAPGEFASAGWSVKSSSILDGRKVWGTGTGYFEYEFPWPSGVKPEDGASVEFAAELASRRIQGKDMDDTFERMTIESVGTRGIDPGHNPNSYPMTDGKQDPSTVRITLNGASPRDVHLADDPSDHRGILSWLAQKEDGYLHEAGSYGYPVRVAFDSDAVARAASEGVIRIRLEVAEAGDGFGGLSVYGESFGRFPMDPAVLVKPAQ